MPKTWRWGRKAGASVLRGQPALEHLPGLTPHATTDRACTSNPTVLPVGCHCHHCQTIVNSQLSTMFC